MKYPIGTIVKILTEEDIRRRLDDKDVCPVAGVTFNFNQMPEYCGEVATIKGYYDRINFTYFLSVDGIDNRFLWSHQWLCKQDHFNEELFTI